MEKKVTKKDVLVALKDAVAEDFEVQVGDVTVTADDIFAYADTTMEQLAAKAAKAKERAAKNKAEGDELRATIEGVLTDELQTIDQITAQIDVEDITKSKVTARLTQLVKAGLAYKEQVKLEDGRKVMAYAAGQAPVVEDDAE